MIDKKYIENNSLELFEDCFQVDENPVALQWEMSEADNRQNGVVDGVGILGRAVGPFFVVD